MNIGIWPYAETDKGWTIPLEVMQGVWDRMVDLNRVKATFYDGGIQNEGDFIEYMQSPFIFPVLGVDSNRICFKVIAWLKDVEDGKATGHFCYLDNYHPDPIMKILDYWSKLDSLRVIIGVTPEHYYATLKMIGRIGFKVIGKIPQFCNMHYENQFKAGVVSYYLLNEGEDNGGK